MRLTFEIDDDEVRRKIEQQLAGVVNETISRSIDRMLEEIVRVKMDRLTDEVLGKKVEEAATNLLRNSLGSDGWRRDAKIKELVEQAALKLVKEKLK